MPSSKRSKTKNRLATPPLTPAIMDDENSDLMNDLLAQLDSRNETVQAESANVLKEMNLNAQADAIESKPKQDAKSRFNARQARKAAALAESYSPDDPAVQARLEKEAREELSAIEKVCNELNLEMYEINPDGHCLFSAVADQLNFLGILPPEKANYAYTRAVAADHIYSHPDDFIPFLPSAEGEDSSGALDAGLMSPEDFKKYCLSMRDTAIWGGEPEIVALTRAFNVPIHVVQGGQPPVVVHNPVGKESDIHDQGVVRISYHRKLYGLGEHYNSLRTKPRKIPIS